MHAPDLSISESTCTRRRELLLHVQNTVSRGGNRGADELSAETRVKQEVLFAATTTVLRVEEVCACLECSKASQSVCGDARRTHLICLPLLCPLRDILSLFRCSEQLLGPHQQKQQVRCGDFGWKYHLVSPLQHPLLFARRDTPTIGSRLTFQGV